jgi:hypothetical protein
MSELHVVICRGDRDPAPGAPKAPYELATRTVFESREAAEAYAAGILPAGREAFVLPLPLAELRVGEDRGRLDYWKPQRVLTSEHK